VAYLNPADRKAYAHKHYEANKDLYKRRAAAGRRKHRQNVVRIIREAKAKPCADCDVQYPYYVMQFDHIGTGKNFDVGRPGTGTVSIRSLQLEIAMCEVVCANCHAERTHQRLVAEAGLEPAASGL
jgi:hypothetical protein